MKIITVVSDEENHGFFILKLSCAVQDLNLVALVAPRKSFETNRLKDSILRSYLEDLDAEEIVLFTDGYDAIMMSGEEELLSKFSLFHKDLVFSTETNCWPDQNLASEFPSDQSTPYRYLNSGGFIGRVGCIKALLDGPAFEGANKFAYSNQYTWSKIFLENQSTIALDSGCQIFCTLSPEVGKAYLPKDTAEKSNNRDYSQYYHFMHDWFHTNFIVGPSRIFNKTTNTYPCHVHFNGDSKVLMDNEVCRLLLNGAYDRSRIEVLYAAT